MSYASDALIDTLERQVKKTKAENAKLREFCSELLQIAESNDPDFLHWLELHDELRKLGVKIVKI